MKTKRTKKLLAFIIATAMAVLLMGTVVSADGFTYTPKAVTTNITFKKVLALPQDSPIPDVGFAFTITNDGVTEVDADPVAGTFGVKKGIITNGYPKVVNAATSDNTVTFSSEDSKDTDTDAGAIAKGYDSSCTKTLGVDFTGVTFPEPGLYRYIISESAAPNYANVAVGYDTAVYMDVYVADKTEGTTKVLDTPVVKFVRPASSSEAIPTTDGNYPSGDTKTDSFVNTYPTNTLTLSKTVNGNQASRDQWFEFIITLTPPTGKTIDDDVTLNVIGQVREPSENAATKYTAAAMKAANYETTRTWEDFSNGWKLYLQHGNTVQIQGIPEGCGVSIEEVNKDYTVETSKTVGTDAAVIGTSATVTEDDIKKPVTVAYTNTKTGTIPTGVILSVAGLLVVGIFAVIGFVFFGLRSKRRYDED